MELDTKFFPKGFIFATATSAYQIEGSNELDGRGRSIWDEIREQKGRIAGDPAVDVSCEARLRYKEDVQTLKELGVSHYRFSISWSRVLPDGTARKVNEEGIKFYRDLCEELLANGIKPIVSLFHADVPLAIYDDGGWLNPKNNDHFVDFCRVCFEKLGDLVKIWITFNEIAMQAWSAICRIEGHPWHCPDRPDPENKRQAPYIGGRNMLLAHARVYRLYQSDFKGKGGQVGITHTGKFTYPASNKQEDIDASRRAFDWLSRWTMDPIFTDDGDFPASMRAALPFLSSFSNEEKAMLKNSADFLGFNYYCPFKVRALEAGKKTQSLLESDGDFDYVESWEKICGETWIRYAPEGLHDLLLFVKDNYKNIPTFVTENGCMDIVDRPVEPLEDDHRVRYIEGHILAVQKAIQAGCKVLGYTLWSFIDNFEWDDGFTVRFGVYRIDFADPDKKRVAKKSARFYRNFIDSFNKC